MDFDFEHRVAIVAILKNEGDYVKEWLDYHILAGISKFYLYDNESTDNMKEVLLPYIDSGVVEYTYWPGKYIQIAAYVDAVKRHKFDCKWLAAIDGDEFILPLNDKSIGETLDEIAAQDDRIGAVVVHWQMFGSSHHIKKPDGGVLKNFTHCGEKPSDLVKSIVNPRCVDFWTELHKPTFYYGKVAVEEDGKPAFTWMIPIESTKKICINHYMTKSKEEYDKRRALGKADMEGKYKEDAFKRYDKNEIQDTTILNYYESRKKDVIAPRWAYKYSTDNIEELFKRLRDDNDFCKNHKLEYALLLIHQVKKYHKSDLVELELLFWKIVSNILDKKLDCIWEMQMFISCINELSQNALVPMEQVKKTIFGPLLGKLYLMTRDSDLFKSTVSTNMYRGVHETFLPSRLICIWEPIYISLIVYVECDTEESNVNNIISNLKRSSFKYIEVIVVFDDDMEYMYHRYSEKFLLEKHVKVIWDRFGKGKYHAWNFGLWNAEGDYVIFSEVSDVYKSTCLEYLYRTGESEKADVVEAIGYDSELKKSEIVVSENEVEKINSWLRLKIFDSCDVKMYRRDFLGKNNLLFTIYDDVVGISEVFHFKCVLHARKYAQISLANCVTKHRKTFDDIVEKASAGLICSLRNLYDCLLDMPAFSNSEENQAKIQAMFFTQFEKEYLENSEFYSSPSVNSKWHKEVNKAIKKYGLAPWLSENIFMGFHVYLNQGRKTYEENKKLKTIISEKQGLK